MPHYTGDPNRDHIFDSRPYSYTDPLMGSARPGTEQRLSKRSRTHSQSKLGLLHRSPGLWHDGALRVQVPNSHTLTQTCTILYSYYPKPKYLIIGYMDPLGSFCVPMFTSAGASSDFTVLAGDLQAFRWRFVAGSAAIPSPEGAGTQQLGTWALDNSN